MLNQTTPPPGGDSNAEIAQPDQRVVTSSPALLKLWWEKHKTGLVRNDPELLVLRRAGETEEGYTWGTVFYSKAREDYKTKVSSLPSERAAAFDQELMAQLQIGRAGNLLIFANPNSIVPGHLVLYPAEQREELTLEDVRDMCRLAAEQTAWTFIHNMPRAAASIVDWVHYQAYPWEFPLQHEAVETIYDSEELNLSRLPETYPAYALMITSENEDILASWLFEMLSALAAGSAASGGKRIPCNIVWRGRRAWLVPRSLGQTILAATYVGGLEMGGLFCLPNADQLRQYLPDALSAEVRHASIAGEPKTCEWCEQTALEIARRLASSDRAS
jgi:hypothetical protein